MFEKGRPMSKLDLVDKLFGDLRYMKRKQADLLFDMICSESAGEILEIGFYQGKSSAYIAAMLEDNERGHLMTIDRRSAETKSPNIHEVLEDTGLAHRVTPIFAKRSYTWELQKLISKPPRPQFDLCYFDGGHTWDDTGFGVLLVDMLLRPGGLIILDDMDWSPGNSRQAARSGNKFKNFSRGELEAKSVRLVWDTILPHLGYEHVREYPEVRWGVARKPMDR